MNIEKKRGGESEKGDGERTKSREEKLNDC